MECPLTLIVGVTRDGQTLTIKDLQNQHNHEINKSCYEHLPRQRKLDTDTKNEVKNMLKLKANKKMVQYELTQNLGKIVTMKDIHNLGRQTNTTQNDTLSTLLTEMKSIPGMLFHYFVK